MLDKNGFDLWADGYDQAVGLSDEQNTYPFAGYKKVLGAIYQAVLQKERPTVLDIAFGTGVLTARLYEQGCQIWGQDFSPKMTALAQAKMPRARLYTQDFTQGLHPELLALRYDFIVSTYALHHLTPAQQRPFLAQLVDLLRPGGQMLVGDVAFAGRAALEHCRAEAGGWDPEEFYFIYDELLPAFPRLRFQAMSHCAGLLTLDAPPAP